MQLLAFLLSIAASVTTSVRDTALGFTGDGQQDAAIWAHSLNSTWFPWYATEGNQCCREPDSTNDSIEWFTNGTNYSYTESQPSGFKTVTGIANLEVRYDGLQYDTTNQNNNVIKFFKKSFWHHFWSPLTGRALSGMEWYSPNALSLIQTEQPVIVDFLRRERTQQPSSVPTTWAISNEPNLYPPITPRQYADIFTRYYRVIKDGSNGDPDAMVGSTQMSNDLLIPGAVTLLNQMFAKKLSSYDRILYGDEVAALVTTFATSELWPLFSGWAFVSELGLSGYSNLAYSRAKRDTRNCIVRRLKLTDDGVWADQPTVPWFNTFLSALPDDVAPDFIGLHVYPLLYHGLNGYGLDSALHSVDRQVRELQLAWVDRYASVPDTARIHAIARTYPDSNLTSQTVQTSELGARHVPAVWVTEFGNINPAASDSSFTSHDALVLIDSMWNHFAGNPNIHRWFFYEPARVDSKFSQYGFTAPMGRLIQDTVATSTFACDSLSIIGKYFHERLTGSACGTSTTAAARIALMNNNDDWSSSSTLSWPTWLHPTTSKHALLVSSTGYRVISRKVPAALLTQSEVYGRIGVDVFVPSAQQNPWWMGEAQVLLNAPKLGLWNRWIGRQSFDSSDRGNWNPVSIPLPTDVVQVLKGQTDSVEVNIVLLGDGAFGVDGLRVEKVIPSRFPSIRPTRRILDYEDLGDWSSTQATLRLDTANVQSGRYDLHVKATGWSQVESGEFDRNSILPRHKYLITAFRRPSGGNAGWSGALAAELTCKNQGINNAWLGQVDLSTLSENMWAMVSFPLPSALASATANGACHVDWVINSNGTDREFVFDRMGFSATQNWEDEASIALTSTGGATGYSDTAWTAGTWRTEDTLDLNWIVIPVVSGRTDSMLIQMEDSLGRTLYGTWEAKTADGSWYGTDSLKIGDTASLRAFHLPATPMMLRIHLLTPEDPSQCPVDSSSGLPVCTGISVETTKVLWDYVLPGEDEDLEDAQ